MEKAIFNFFDTLSSSEPKFIDRLIVSSFLSFNNIKVINNKFIKEYIITENKEKEYETFLKLNILIKKESGKFSFENLIELFEFVVSPEDKIVTGAIYTPAYIRSFIINNALSSRNSIIPRIKIADIACGCGSFLFDIAKELKKILNEKNYFEIFKSHLFGLDIQEYSVVRTKILLSLLALSNNEDNSEFIFNLKIGDALSFKWKQNISTFTGFDIIVGNPPYVCSRSIPDTTKQFLKDWVVCKSGHPDLYIPFFQIGLENLNEGGILGYITMNTFFKSVNGRELRKYFNDKSYFFKIIDFGALQVFKAKSTYTCICMIEKKKSPELQFFKCNDLSDLNNSRIDFHHISYNLLDAKEGWNLSLNNAILRKIESAGISLSKKFKSRNGIATLKNNIYIFKPVEETQEYCYIESDGFHYPIEKGICRDIINPNMLINETDLRNIKEKIIFPYEINGAVVSVLKGNTFRKNFPSAYAYLLTKKSLLATRDKSKGGNYKPWYKFGRNQSLEKLKYKLFFPHITPKTPNYVINTNENLLFYNGIAIIGGNRNELIILRKILSSRIFWFYIKNTSKPYGDSYYSLSKNYFKNFGIPLFSSEEEAYLLAEYNEELLNNFLERKYNVDLANNGS